MVMIRSPPERSKTKVTFLSGAYALPCSTALTAASRTAMEICMISSSGKPSSVAIRVAFSSALSIVSNEESSVYETRCSVMAIDEVNSDYTAWTAILLQIRSSRSPEAIPSECGSLPVGWANCQCEVRTRPLGAKAGAPSLLSGSPETAVLCCDHRRVVMSQVSDHRVHQSLHVVPTHANQFAMRARGECDLLVFGQTLIGVHAHVIEIAERRHRARLAIGEGVFELALGGDLNYLRAR